ncbi:E3 ubiquitin-protein ligase UPL6-like protein [Carex littledalei]|uniref:E3 ubiquitin-protein ligase UPL6-like protein n=1 Tax=Carex littledalei TaxID=544730 RepID=A0A833RDV8_9POAL|nr:E3 ubiquitin-protein ligase UPL6-like protein [Carex littledalei]
MAIRGVDFKWYDGFFLSMLATTQLLNIYAKTELVIYVCVISINFYTFLLDFLMLNSWYLLYNRVGQGNVNEEVLNRLPTSATCMNLLKLPPYTRKLLEYSGTKLASVPAKDLLNRSINAKLQLIMGWLADNRQRFYK